MVLVGGFLLKFAPKNKEHVCFVVACMRISYSQGLVGVILFYLPLFYLFEHRLFNMARSNVVCFINQ